jgi:hypothetical protein
MHQFLRHTSCFSPLSTTSKLTGRVVCCVTVRAQQYDVGFKRKGPDDVPFVQRVHAVKATQKNKIGLVTDQFVS